MNNVFNWDGISIPQSNLNVRKLAVNCHHELFIGKNEYGKQLFIICLKGNQELIFKKHKITISGLDIDLRKDSHEKQNLVITLEDKLDEDIFTLLIKSIIFSITTADSSRAIHEVFKAIKRWKLFLASKRMHILTPSQIRGLYAELTFLMTLLSEASAEDHQSILDAWKGPQKAQHDFIFNNIAIEIKSLNGDERSTVKISSEDQLESKFKKLSLKVYALGESEYIESRLSLNQLVEDITTHIESLEQRDTFYSKLSFAGYLPLEEYNRPQFIISSEKTFSIIDDFPRLTKSNLPVGIVRTSYEILLTTISRFEISNKITWRS